MVAGVPAQGIDGLHPLRQGAGGDVPLPGPGAGQFHHFVAAVGQVQAEAHGTVQLDRSLAGAGDLGVPRQGGQLLEEGIEQLDRDAGQRVGQGDRQGGGFTVLLCIGRGQTLDGRLARRDGMLLVAEVQQAAAVRHLGVQRRQVHIPGAAGGVFLFDMLQRVGVVSVEVAHRHRAGRGLEQAVEVRAVLQGFAAVQLAQVAAGQHFENVADRGVVQMERPALRVEHNGHRGRSFLLLVG